jgi:hypothetical protein
MMNQSSTSTRWIVGAITIFAALAIAPRIEAQDGYLFNEPSASFALRIGYAAPSASSDVFSFTTNQLTINRGDFAGLDLSAELAFRVSSRADIVINTGFSGMSRGSEFRNFVDNNNQPIQQRTTFQRVPITASLRYYLEPRGEKYGHFAWIPARWAPYVGAGAGFMEYEFDQRGDFIDFSTNNVFPDHFHSGGWTPMGQALAGIDWSLGTRWALTTEAKYVIANAALSDDFAGFHRIDLSGFSTTVGFSVRY